VESTSFDRNHGPILHKSAETHTVLVDGLVANRLELSVAGLANDFPQHTVTCALQCAGNRRHSMRTRIKEVTGVDWFDGAIMNCVFEGPRLCDILLAAGVGGGKHLHDGVSPKHVQFASLGKTQEDDWYGGSIPLSRALDRDMDVILVLKVCVPSYKLAHLNAHALVLLDEWYATEASPWISCKGVSSRGARG
jgi:sulfite oxidase